MKSYTNIEQGKKLAEILSHDSADMYYMRGSKYAFVIPHREIDSSYFKKGNVLCWSLAALINILTTNYARQTINITKGGWLNDGTIFSSDYFITYEDSEDNYFELHSEELIDVVIDMIVKLKEDNLI